MSCGLIAVVGLFFLGMGLYGLAAPRALARPFAIAVETPAARAEVRAVYGGFGVAVAGIRGRGAAGGRVGGQRNERVANGASPAMTS